MILSVKDRVVISSLYPKESDLMTQIMVREIAKKVELSQKELEVINFKKTEQGFAWDASKEKEKEVELTKTELRFLKDQVDRLDKERKIIVEIVDLCVKIRDTK